MTSKKEFIVITTESGQNVKVRRISAQGHHKEAFVTTCRNLLDHVIVYNAHEGDWDVMPCTGRVFKIQFWPVVANVGGGVRGLWVVPDPDDPKIVARLVRIQKVIGVVVDESNDF